jgi:hypothetical protein
MRHFAKWLPSRQQTTSICRIMPKLLQVNTSLYKCTYYTHHHLGPKTHNVSQTVSPSAFSWKGARRNLFWMAPKTETVFITNSAIETASLLLAQEWRLALSAGPRVGSFLAFSPKDGGRPSFRKVVGFFWP